MAESLIGPWYAQIRYRSKYALHTFKTSTVEAYVTPITGVLAFDNSPGGTDKSIATAMDELGDLWAALYPATWSAIDYIVFHQPDPELAPTPFAAGAMGHVGTLVASFLTDRATQLQFNFRTAGGAKLKHVLMDFPIGSFTPNYGPLGGGFLALQNYIQNGDAWIVSRTSEKASGLVSLTATINDANEQKYNRLLLT